MTTCTICNNSFQVRPEDLDYYKKFDAPAPKKCPECRLQQRLTFRNERSLFRRKSSLSSKSLISIYADDCIYPIYSNEEWWSDKWDAANFGRDYDFSKSFFSQFEELRLKVPRIALFNVNPENSEYCQQAYDNRNCYLCTVVTECKDCSYVSHSNNLTDCMDCHYIQHSELCYECLDSDKLYNCCYSQNCQNSSELYFCRDCIGCHNCIGCSGLRNKRYCVKNKQVTKEEFETALAKFKLESRINLEKIQEHLADWNRKQPLRALEILNTENCIGNYLVNSKNCFQCFDSFGIEDCAYCTWIFNSKDCFDVFGLGGGELAYSCIGVEKVTDVAFCSFVSHSNNCLYSDLCFYSENLFGCVGLRNKKNFILNKEYKREEYDALKAKIIAHMKSTGEWGEFFPVNLSPYCYNDTAAQLHYPSTKEEAISLGARWRNPSPKDYAAAEASIPDNRSELNDEITKKVLACKSCKKNFKINAQEISLYNKMKVGPSADCPDCRATNRFLRRNPRFLWQRKCGDCNKELLSPIATARPEKVVCESCYQNYVD